MGASSTTEALLSSSLSLILVLIIPGLVGLNGAETNGLI